MLIRGQFSVGTKLNVRGKSQTGNKSYGLGLNKKLLDKINCLNPEEQLVYVSAIDNGEIRISSTETTVKKVFQSFEKRITPMIDLFLYKDKPSIWYELESRFIKLAIYQQYYAKLSDNNAPLMRIRFEKLALSSDIEPLRNEILNLRVLSLNEWIDYLEKPAIKTSILKKHPSVTDIINDEFETQMTEKINNLIEDIKYIKSDMMTNKKLVNHIIKRFK